MPREVPIKNVDLEKHWAVVIAHPSQKMIDRFGKKNVKTTYCFPFSDALYHGMIHLLSLDKNMGINGRYTNMPFSAKSFKDFYDHANFMWRDLDIECHTFKTYKSFIKFLYKENNNDNRETGKD